MTIYRPATKQDVAAVSTVWVSAFLHDTEEDCRRFLAAVPTEWCLVAEVDGTVASIVFSIPAVIGGNTFQYIYAAATHPDYRSRGLFGELLRFALDTAKDKGYAGSFLHPAEPSLTAYYARFGYRPWTYCQTECGEAAGELALEQISSAAYAEARALPPLCVEWPRPLLTYAAECGGAYKTKGAVLLCEKRGDTLLIKEQLGVADAAAVCNVLGAKRYERVCEKDSGDVYTLLLPFFEQELAPPYIGPVFD